MNDRSQRRVDAEIDRNDHGSSGQRDRVHREVRAHSSPDFIEDVRSKYATIETAIKLATRRDGGPTTDFNDHGVVRADKPTGLLVRIGKGASANALPIERDVARAQR